MTDPTLPTADAPAAETTPAMPQPQPDELGCPEASADEPLDFIFDGAPRGYLYVLERLVLTDAAIQNWEAWSAHYRAAAISRKWERVLVCTEITGDPRLFIQIWRVPAPFSIDVELTALRLHSDYRVALTGIA